LVPPPEPSRPTLDSILDDFTRSWERGERPRAERYLDLLSFEESAELIYHEYCLADTSDLGPDPADYLRRFPEHSRSLGRLFALHGVFSSSKLREWTEPADLPVSGDEIGPYRLLRELGRGGFARVFLAEQSDLDHRLVVLKISTRETAEPRLLARARHAHIVEVLRHAVAENGALHLVCMPFLGGATLAAVLEERRRRGRQPRSGRDLLADLDRVAAPEYPSTELARPAREILSKLSYAQALAWIVARLAEALDHAHKRGVDHGDLKPSNVLLTAEANPLLLDFNLSVDGRDSGNSDAELGGTMAYMAPERLDAIAGKSRESSRKAADLHRADLYALGLLLLEALTGKAPEVARHRASNPRDLAAELAGLRRVLPAPLGSRSHRAIPSALRSILTKCLAPDPLDRYARGNELAEDLDRWRSDRPLTFAEESRTSELTRQARRRRAPLVAFALSMTVAVGVSWAAWIILQGTQRDQALDKYSAILERPDPTLFGFRNQIQLRPDDLGDPLEAASRQLARYDVLDDPQWRNRDDIRSLPDRERNELEVWLFEQILRYAIALGETPESPESWGRGLALLDRTLEQVQSEPLQAQRLVLLDQLKRADRASRSLSGTRLPRWMDAYLAGVAAEPLHARQAMDYYLEALRERPELFWAHYRTSVVAERINEYVESVRHQRYCIGRSPDNPALHAQLASKLFCAARDMRQEFKHDPFAEALQESDRALKLDPDFVPAYRIRAYLLNITGQAAAVQADLGRYIVLSRRLGSAPAAFLRGSLVSPGNNHFFKSLQDQQTLERLSREVLESDPNNPEIRTNLALLLKKAGRNSEALEEYDRVLKADPDRLRARYDRATLIHLKDSDSAIKEYGRLIEHPQFEEFLCDNPIAMRTYHYVATDLMERGKIDEAIAVMERCLVLVNRSKALAIETLKSRQWLSYTPLAPKGETYYVLARMHYAGSTLVTNDPEKRRHHFDRTIEYLKLAISHTPDLRDHAFVKDRLFDDSRAEIIRRIDQQK
jgi:serine/threonine protein kinase